MSFGVPIYVAFKCFLCHVKKIWCEKKARAFSPQKIHFRLHQREISDEPHIDAANVLELQIQTADSFNSTEEHSFSII